MGLIKKLLFVVLIIVIAMFLLGKIGDKKDMGSINDTDTLPVNNQTTTPSSNTDTIIIPQTESALDITAADLDALESDLKSMEFDDLGGLDE